MPDPPTNVIFRRWKNLPRTVIAVFPDLDAGDHMVVMYEHIGQHGGGYWHKVVNVTRPARLDESDVAALKAELEARGYVLRVRRRANWDTLGSIR